MVQIAYHLVGLLSKGLSGAVVFAITVIWNDRCHAEELGIARFLGEA